MIFAATNKDDDCNMSFLSDILTSAGHVEKGNLHEKVVEVQKEITRLKHDVKDVMDDNYVEFTPKLTRDRHLVAQVKSLLKETDALQKKIDDQVKIELSGSVKELNMLSQALKESNMSLLLSDQLLTMHKCIKEIKSSQKEKRYVDTAKTLVHMQAILNDPLSDLHDLDLYTAIMAERQKLHNSFRHEASTLLHKRICWTGTEDGKSGIVTLCIKDEHEDLQELAKGLHCIDNLSSHLQKFATKLMDFIASPIIKDECSVYLVDDKVFTVEILDQKQIQSYKRVLYNLELLFKFLYRHLNLTIDKDQTFLKRVQPYLLDRLAESLTKDCISHTIPTSSADFQNFAPVIEAINAFQIFLVKIDFITTDQLFLSEYTKNIDKLFIERICQDLLGKAQNIMKKDLHDSVVHEPQDPLLFFKNADETAEINIDNRLSDVQFQFPKCQISKSAKETLDLARDILDEVCRSPDACAVQLFYICRNVFEMYTGLVPEHHRKFLETIPQQVALFHNNCMYLAHHLLTLSHEYTHRFSESLQNLNLTFTDQITVLRNVGSRYFLQHMRYQRDIIFDILKESGLSALGQTSELHPNTERALRQCIRQLELLKTVWLDVLPVHIYCKSLGCISNSMVEGLIYKVVSVEDIPADVATELVTLFDMVVKRTPIVFPDSTRIGEHVRKWGKFLELIKILGASLKEIEINWGSGKGPLAREFTATEVKQLIRALFQNTERRSNLLASIT